jgi:CDP-diacylglycerol--glycerol-3-phosphate 3-phosphatidyltransferase
MNKNKIFNISNSLSFLRLLLALPLCWLIMNNQNISALVIALIAILTDILDGYFARKRNEITEIGKIIDPVADKVIIGAVAIVMIIKSMVPVWFVAAILSRDLLILLGGLYLSKKLGYLIYSDIIGKVSVIILAFVMIGLVFKIGIFRDYGIYLALAALLVSFINYFIRMIILVKKKVL